MLNAARTFRLSAKHDVVLFDRLPPGQRERLSALRRDPEFFGVVMTILAPAVIGYDTAATSRLVPNEQRLLLLKKATDRPNLHNVDPTATAFIPKRSNIRDVHDITLLGTVSPNPVFGLEQQHECSQPFR